MTECITARLKSLIGAILPVYLEEAEVEVYPFATYDILIRPSTPRTGYTP